MALQEQLEARVGSEPGAGPHWAREELLGKGPVAAERTHSRALN